MKEEVRRSSLLSHELTAPVQLPLSLSLSVAFLAKKKSVFL